MFLKSLELNGFKSFANKTVLEFPEGITAIVGPNGSGKSNVIDAIRWLLGEREAKNLRGAKTEDLIFNGTPHRPRVSLAQAGLYFDNRSGFFPVDFNEVVVSRRISRDGTSQYFLNKSEVRLKDIIDFFSRSRLGTKGLIIINQGNSDLFVRVTPEERRVMIEEILGLREYQLKKSEAERKLKTTTFNLEKVHSMVEEVVPRMKLLNRQAQKWAKRAELEQELLGLEDEYFGSKLAELVEAEKKQHTALLHREGELREKQEALHHAQKQLKEVEDEKKEEGLRALRDEENKLLDARAALQREWGKLEVKLEMMSVRGKPQFQSSELLNLIEEVRHAIREILQGEKNYDAVAERLGGLRAKIDTFLDEPGATNTQERETLTNLKKEYTEKLESVEQEITRLREQSKEITERLEGFNDRFKHAFAVMEEKREALIREERARAEVLLEKERIEMRQQELESRIREVGRTRKEIEAKEIKRYAGEELYAHERAIMKIRGELASIGEIDESLMKEAKEVQAHYEFLTTQSKDLEIAIADLKKLIKELQTKIHSEFTESVKKINTQFDNFFHVMFGGGSAKLKIVRETKKIEEKEESGEEGIKKVEHRDESQEETSEEETVGIEVELHIPRKRITSLESLSGGEKSLVSIAALFALISVSPPPFLVLDEIDAALDESNSRRFSNLVKEFSKKTQFIIVTHNRTTMESADVLYGVTVGQDGTSKVLSVKLESVPAK